MKLINTDSLVHSKSSCILPIAALLAALGYWLQWTFDSKLLSIALKMTPACAMALEVFRQRRLSAWPMIAALLCHAVGDGLLDLGKKFLLAGMGAFFLGHLGYIAAFFPYRRRWQELSPGKRSEILILVIVMISLTAFIWPKLPGILAVASPVYSLALTVMAVFALSGNWGNSMVGWGAVLFVLSDIVLGFRLFLHWKTFAPIIWPTYASAQILIPLGYLRAADEKASAAS